MEMKSRCQKAARPEGIALAASFDPAARKWKAEPGQFEILIGASPRDIRLRQAFELRR